MAVVEGGYIYVGGGVNYSDKVLKACERYSIRNDKWEAMPYLREERKNGAMVAFQGKWLFALGGISLNTPLDSIERI